jgi:hypothetical protein
MKLCVAGHPLHTRSLTVSSHRREDGRHDVRGAVVDLRKCGFVPVAGMLQTSGIIHHMTLDGVLDPATRTLDSLEGGMLTPAFEASEFTRGESCRDPLPRLQALAGRPLDETFVARLREVFGAHLGCSHLLALGQLTATSLLGVLEPEAAHPEQGSQWRAGERVFQRAVEFDGFELDGAKVDVAVQLTDLHFRPADEVAYPMQRFGEQVEVRIRARIDLEQGAAIQEIEAFERRRGYEDLESADWRDRSREIELLVGQSVMAGMSKRLVSCIGDASVAGPSWTRS